MDYCQLMKQNHSNIQLGSDGLSRRQFTTGLAALGVAGAAGAAVGAGGAGAGAGAGAAASFPPTPSPPFAAESSDGCC